MKNLEKFPRTNDALAAWRQSVEGGVSLSFDEWAQREYEAPRGQTLLEAAEAVIKEWRPGYGCDIDLDSLERCMGRLSESVKCEKSRPVRNCDKYRTEKEAYEGFRGVCDVSRNCSNCRFRDCYSMSECAIAYLYGEAKKESAK